MKLPDMQIGGVQKFAAAPAGQAAAAARAEIGADQALAGAIGKAGEFTTAMADLAIQRQNTNAEAETLRISNDLIRDAKKSPYTTSENVPEDYEVLGGRTKEVPDAKGGQKTVDRNIPVWEVFPEMYRDEMTKTIKEKGSHIASRTHRENFEREALAKLDNAYTDLSGKRYDVAKDMTRKEELELERVGLQGGNYDFVRATIKNSVVFDANEKEVRTNKVDKRQETDAIDTSMTETDAPLMAEFLADLTDSDTYSGYLNDSERLTYVKALSASLRASQTASKEVVKTQHKLLRDEMGDMVTESKKGTQFSPQLWNTVYERALAANAIDPGSMAVPLKHFNDLRKHAPTIRSFQLMPEIEAENMLSTLHGMPKGDTEAANLARILDGVNASKNTAIKRDALSYANSIGLVTLSEVDLTSAKGVGSTIANRIPSYDTTNRQYGRANGLLTADEATRLSTVIGTMTHDKKVELAANVNNALGSRSDLFWKQIGQEDEMKTYAIAGRISSDGDNKQSLRIMKGADARKRNPEILRNVKTQLKPDIRNKLGGMYSATPRYEDAIVESILDEYALQLVEAQDFDSVSFNVTQSAVDAITGSAVTYNGAKIENVDRNAPADTINKWVGDRPNAFIRTVGMERDYDALAPVYIDSLGGVTGFSSSELLSQIRDGRVKLQTIGKGEYRLHIPSLNTDAKYLKNASTGMDFVLIYNSDAPRASLSMGER